MNTNIKQIMIPELFLAWLSIFDPSDTNAMASPRNKLRGASCPIAKFLTANGFLSVFVLPTSLYYNDGHDTARFELPSFFRTFVYKYDSRYSSASVVAVSDILAILEETKAEIELQG